MTTIPQTTIPKTTAPKATQRSYSARYLERVRELDAFCTLHARLPSQLSTEHAERSLYFWVAAQRHAKHISPVLERLLRDFAPDRAPCDPLARLEELKLFCATHGRPPSSQGDTTTERRLYYWMSYQRQNGLISPTLEHLPRDFVPNRAPRSAHARLKELEAFCSAHRRLPSQYGDTAEERGLFSWMSQHRLRRTPMPRLYELYEQYRRPRGRPRRGTRPPAAV